MRCRHSALSSAFGTRAFPHSALFLNPTFWSCCGEKQVLGTVQTVFPYAWDIYSSPLIMEHVRFLFTVCNVPFPRLETSPMSLVVKSIPSHFQTWAHSLGMGPQLPGTMMVPIEMTVLKVHGDFPKDTCCVNPW